MADHNKTQLIGRLTRDPELRHTPGGAAVANFGLAVNRKWKTKAGEDKEEALFIEIEAWAKLGELCNQYVGKGSLVFLEGSLRLDQWESKEGERRSKIKVVAQNVQFLDKREKAEPAGEDEGDVPF